MFKDLRRRVKKTGQVPGTPIYTGNKNIIPEITVINYSQHDFHEVRGQNLEDCLAQAKEEGNTWINVQGLSNVAFIEQLAARYHLHPLTLEDLLNVEQRPKIEEFEGYLFLTIKMLAWRTKHRTFAIEQVSLVLGKNFILSFLEKDINIFEPIIERLRSTSQQRLRQQGSDYLLYRLIDTVIDHYFVVLEKVGEQIESMEEHIIASPTPPRARQLYQMKRRMLLLRKAVWPMREVISHLTQTDEKFITPFTRTYLRDIYDHTVQALDTLETFRDILASILDVYLSSLTNRMNEVMKMLTIISTIFIPMTFIASIYGMNFEYMPELHSKHGYPLVISLMVVLAIIMLFYFRRKKWL